MYVYNKVWYNKFNRTIIFSFLMTAWAFFIELYFFFWPKETLEKEFLINLLYIKILHLQPLIIIFHTIIWSICFFFGWIFYTLVKELGRYKAPDALEYGIIGFVISVFIAFMNSIPVAFLFLVVITGEFFYMFLSLRD